MKPLLEKWNKFIIAESSLSRLHKHISEHDTAIITAYRNDPTAPEGCTTDIPAVGVEEEDSSTANKERNRELKASLLKSGYGVTRVDGSYIENFDNPATRKEVSEESFFVVNLEDDPSFAGKIEELGQVFCQDSVLIIPHGGEEAYLLGTNDSFSGFGQKEPVGGFKGGEEAEFMSRVRKRPFVFKEIRLQETYSNLSRNAKWAVTKISERVAKNV